MKLIFKWWWDIWVKWQYLGKSKDFSSVHLNEEVHRLLFLLMSLGNFQDCSSCRKRIPPCRKCVEWLGTSVLCLTCFCLCTCTVQSFWLIQLGNNVHFLFSFLMFYQRIEDCKTSPYCMNYCIHLFIWGKVDGFDACNRNNASSQQSEQHSLVYFDLVNKHGSFFLFLVKVKCSLCCIKFFFSVKRKRAIKIE